MAPPREASELISSRTFLITALIVTAILFAVYAPALNFQFILDDHRFTGDPRIQSSGHVWDYFANYVWAQFTGGPPSFYRPVFLLWMRMNFLVSALSPWGWHLLSITKHATVALLLGLLTYQLLRDRVAALLAATLFALHPAQTESVAWVTVPDPLMSAGVLGALLLYLRYVESLPVGRVQGNKTRKAKKGEKVQQTAPGWLVASAVLFLTALLAKETAIILPLVIFVLALFIPRNLPGLTAARTKDVDPSFAVRLERALRQIWPFVVATALYLVLRLNALDGKLSAVTQHLPLTTVVLSWPATLWFYVKVLLWPVKSYAFADPDLVERFSAHGILLPGLFVVGMVAIVATALVWAWRKAQRDLTDPEAASVKYALLIGALLLVLPLLPTLNLNALNPGDFLHGRYTYLPSAGLMLLAATGWHIAGKWRLPCLCAAALFAVSFTTFTVMQEKQWKDDLTVFTIAHQLAPHNTPVAMHLADAHVQGALQLADEGRCSEAVPIIQQVTQEFPQDWFACAALGNCLVQLDDLPRAEESFHRAADLSHDPRMIEQWQELRAHMGLPRSAPAQ